MVSTLRFLLQVQFVQHAYWVTPPAIAAARAAAQSLWQAPEGVQAGSISRTQDWEPLASVSVVPHEPPAPPTTLIDSMQEQAAQSAGQLGQLVPKNPQVPQHDEHPVGGNAGGSLMDVQLDGVVAPQLAAQPD